MSSMWEIENGNFLLGFFVQHYKNKIETMGSMESGVRKKIDRSATQDLFLALRLMVSDWIETLNLSNMKC